MKREVKVGDWVSWEHSSNGPYRVTIVNEKNDWFQVDRKGGLVRWFLSSSPHLIFHDPPNPGTKSFSTGAQRSDDTGKPRPDLIPGSCMLRIGEHFRKGAEQYGERNYQKGIPQSRHLASLCRHLEQYKRGDTDEDHLAAFITNGIFMMFNEANFPDNPEIMDLKPERDA